MQTLLLLAALASATACITPTLPTQPAAPPDTRAADEAATRAADAEWVKAVAAKDRQQSTFCYVAPTNKANPKPPKPNT